jgi:hypothetical protein
MCNTGKRELGRPGVLDEYWRAVVTLSARCRTGGILWLALPMLGYVHFSVCGIVGHDDGQGLRRVEHHLSEVWRRMD